MSGRRLILLMSVSMGGFAGRPDRTIDWLTPAPAVTTATNAITAKPRHPYTTIGTRQL